MKKYLNIPLLMVVVSLCVSGSCREQKELSVDEFEKAINEFTNEQIVDVRTPEEYAKGHIPGALNININDTGFERHVSSLDKSKPVLVYCLSGARSSKAADFMRSNGFSLVSQLGGGMMKWSQADKPVTVIVPSGKGMSLNQFEDSVKTQKLVLVDFHARWCAPCKKMEPSLKKLQEERNDELALLKIDFDENRSLAKSLGIEALPVLLLFRNGENIWRHNGYLEKQDIEKQLQPFLEAKE